MSWFDNVMMAAAPINWMGANMISGGEASKRANTALGIPDPSQAGRMTGTGAADRQRDLEAGYAKGKELFYDDPDMQSLRKRREDLSKGYSGEELGALRATARGEIAGQRASDQARLSSNLGRGGVGGARAAAVRGATDQRYAGMNQDNERKMALDSANMVRSGTNDLQDFIFRQKYGQLGTGVSYGQMGVADRTADKQNALNNQQQDRGLLGNFLKPLFG